jgi:hypothetical protein
LKGSNFLLSPFRSFFICKGSTPDISPIIFTSSVPEGITILAFDFKEASTVSNFFNSWAFPVKYLSAASLTKIIASASPSACNILARL